MNESAEVLSDASPRTAAGKRKPKVKAKRKSKANKPNGIVGKGKFVRTCAFKSCGVKFRTDDPRKQYHDRACGGKQRSKRWYHAAAQALRKLRKGRRAA